MLLSSGSDGSSRELAPLDDTATYRQAKRSKPWNDDVAAPFSPALSSLPLPHCRPAPSRVSARVATRLSRPSANSHLITQGRQGQHEAPQPYATAGALRALPCPPVGSDGVALGMPWVPLPPAAPRSAVSHLYHHQPYPTSSVPPVFAKTTFMAEPLPAPAAPDVAHIVWDVLSGRLPSLPIGLQLDCQAVVREMTSR
jgi:hypothetical protein